MAQGSGNQGVWDSGRDGLEEKVQGEAGRRPGDACRRPREQREDAKGGKGPDEAGRKGKRGPERPAQGAAHCRHLPRGRGNDAQPALARASPCLDALGSLLQRPLPPAPLLLCCILVSLASREAGRVDAGTVWNAGSESL